MIPRKLMPTKKVPPKVHRADDPTAGFFGGALSVAGGFSASSSGAGRCEIFFSHALKMFDQGRFMYQKGIVFNRYAGAENGFCGPGPRRVLKRR